jgi:hypothetical protein
MVEAENSCVVSVRLLKRNLQSVEAVRALENVDRDTLFNELMMLGCARGSFAFMRKAK